jgi:pimeloyl-[acyl-carrier protein] synthase
MSVSIAPMREEPTLLTLYQPEWVVDPYPYYRRLRESHPVFWDEPLGSWVVTRYDDIVALSRDPRLSEDRVSRFRDHLSAPKREALRQLGDALSDMMLFNNAPRHTELRRMVKGAFSRSATARMRESMARDTEALLDRVAAAGELDVVSDLSQPLSKIVIANLLGIPDEERYLLDDWASLLHEFFTQSTAQVDRLLRLRRIFDAMAQNTAGAGEHLLAHMLSCCPEGAERHDVLFANFLLIIDAGQVTTTYLVPNAVRALLQHPGQLELLRGDGGLMPEATHELMRFDSSVQFTTRIAREELEVGGHVIRDGEPVTLLLGSGNRDPDRFPDPDRLDLTRNAAGHLSFGHGAHYCVGAPLALVEVDVVISAMLRRLPGLRIAAPRLRWHDSINFRFLRRLPVRFDPVTTAR